jgi:anti-anti-sigma factor
MENEVDQDVSTYCFEGSQVVVLRGEWDVSNRDRLREKLLSLGTESDVLVDLREARFFDSTALAELIWLYKRVADRGFRLEALVGGSNMRRLLELTNLDALFGVSAQRAKYLEQRLP